MNDEWQIFCQNLFWFSLLLLLFAERFVYGCAVTRVNIGQVYVNICHRDVQRWTIRPKRVTYSSDRRMALCRSTHCPTIAIDWHWYVIIWRIRHVWPVHVMRNTPDGFYRVDAISCFHSIARKRDDDWVVSHSIPCARHYSESYMSCCVIPFCVERNPIKFSFFFRLQIWFTGEIRFHRWLWRTNNDVTSWSEWCIVCNDIQRTHRYFGHSNHPVFHKWREIIINFSYNSFIGVGCESSIIVQCIVRSIGDRVGCWRSSWYSLRTSGTQVSARKITIHLSTSINWLIRSAVTK